MSLFQLNDPSPPASEPTAANDNDALDVKGAMAVLRLGRNAVYDGCTRGQIPHRRIGKLLRFSRSGLRTWLASPTFPLPLEGHVAKMLACGRSSGAKEGQ